MLNLSKIKAPGDMRPTWRNGILQIHITRACDLACTGCTQGSNLAGKPVMMTENQFYDALISVKDYYGVVGIFGGNPTIHPKFESFCQILKSVIPFEQRGLWSNNLNGYGKLCREIFNPAVSNLNTHTSVEKFDEMKRDWPECNPKPLNDSRHSPPWVAMQDLNIPIDEQERLIENCDINKLWSAMICVFRGELRGFFCEIAGAQSMLHEHDFDYPDTGMKIYPGWWKQPIQSFEDQIYKHCFECGIPLKGFGDLAVNGTVEHVSKTHEAIYKLKRPGTREIKVVTKREELGQELTRATDYIENGLVQKMTNDGAMQYDQVDDLSQANIMIGVPTAGYAKRDDFYDYFHMLQLPPQAKSAFARGQSPARNRNIIIEQALANNCTHILFLDDDIAFQPDLLLRLLNHNKDIVCGLQFMRNYPHYPLIFDTVDEKGRCFHHFLSDGESGMIEIVAAGLGCVLIKTKVFHEMMKQGLDIDQHGIAKRFIRLGELDSDHWCDDLGFWLKVRTAGFKLYCDLDTLVGHNTDCTVWPEKINGIWHSSYDTKGSQKVGTPQMRLISHNSETNERQVTNDLNQEALGLVVK